MHMLYAYHTVTTSTRIYGEVGLAWVFVLNNTNIYIAQFLLLLVLGWALL